MADRTGRPRIDDIDEQDGADLTDNQVIDLAAHRDRRDDDEHAERIATLVSEQIRKNGSPDMVEETPPADEWDGNLAGLLDDIGNLLRAYITMGRPQVVACVLWVAHTHVLEAAGITPYLSVWSATKRCGKTNLLQLLSYLARFSGGHVHVNPSDAVLYRIGGLYPKTPAVVIDEVDELLRNPKDRADTIAMWNAGYRSGARVPRVEKASTEFSVRLFDVYAARAFGSIGQLRSDTLRDRSIPINLLRRSKDDPGQRFRELEVAERAAGLVERLRAWAWHDATIADLKHARPELPDELDDRAQDCWEPLLAIAAAAGGRWPDIAREAAIDLSANRDLDDSSLDVDLLRRCHHALEGLEAIHTADLLARICEDEDSPWRGRWWGDDKPSRSAGRQLALRLEQFGIKPEPKKLQIGTERARGYSRSSFAQAFRTYADAIAAET